MTMDDQAFQGVVNTVDRTAGGWAGLPLDQPKGTDCSDEVVAKWRDLRATLRMLAEHENWSMAEVSRRAGIPGGTFSPWYSGKYVGKYGPVHADVDKWLRALEEARAAISVTLAEPDFLRTRVAAEVLDTLLLAQELPGVVLITLGPGMGKTACAQHVRKTRPNTFLVTMSPSVRNIPALQRELGIALDIMGHPKDARQRIGEKLRRYGRKPLLMIDEAQNLADEAVDELRHYHDVYECGIALIGNEDVMKRWHSRAPKKGYGQLHSRFTDRVYYADPLRSDVEMYVEAWGQLDPEVKRLLVEIGMRPGAFRQIAATLMTASIRAGARGVQPSDIVDAWKRRSGEVLR
jgi:DNA transposition AAA+ family ATPase